MSDLRIIPRQEWGAKYGRGAVGLQTRSEMVIHTAAGALIQPSWTLARVMELVRAIEDFHCRPKSQGGRGWAGIAYTHLVDPIHGWIFEGRGWGRNGAHTQQGRNITAHAICFLGHGDIQAVPDLGWEAAEHVMLDGLARNHIPPEYIVTGHRRYAARSCPGNLIYPDIQRLAGLSVDPVVPPVPEPQMPDYNMAVRFGRGSAADERIARALAAAMHVHVAPHDDTTTVGTVYLVGGLAAREYQRDQAERVFDVAGATRWETWAEASALIDKYLGSLP